ncbi:MAG: phosphoglucosamine mutase [Leptotrichiaceae bacterium]|nr:phosphoglucosamine mutase [Leptotrichiaceae bacterium]MBP6280698.1 phosphoglucosamine mutase [Leptotrichiaceae bacterium]MBP7101347.1 phosphoglucosamine mutase [Leptotrichiaceae bacterium]MBP7725446.1 phosphoglucosamine mutase [Leptotrichiaceae bacterium]MBP9628903.1 phosphoglucosamine mutase [Leptotrichiaceae bacterium]
MARKYFGTDGMRGEANKDLTIDLVTDLGLALGYYLKKNKKGKNKPKVILGTDTRISGYMIRSALSAGLTSMGVHIDFVGVLPTPGVCYLTRKLKADAGIMISASHNPVKDNGIKIFSQNGYKLPDSIEEEIEALMENREELLKYQVPGDDLGRFKYVEDDMRIYLDFLSSTVKRDFKGLKIVIDAANGAAYRVASKIYQRLGADIIVINNIPNGKNINVNCGSTHPELLQEIVKVYNADLGLAYDGDADRLIAVDHTGKIIDGDLIIAIISIYLQKKGHLNDNKIVTTVLSNMGFEKYLDSKGIGLIRANVGDRYVLEKMKEYGLNIGGEQSGHILMLDYNTTGDGVLSSIQLVAAMLESGKTLNELVEEIELWPQKSQNIMVSKDKKSTWETNIELINFIKEKEKEIQGKGRILVRASGTESLIRVMVEAETQEIVDKYVKELADKIENELK